MIEDQTTSLERLRQKVIGERQRIWNQATPAERVRLMELYKEDDRITQMILANRPPEMGA